MRNAPTLIQFTLVLRRGRRILKTKLCWLATVSFADGDGPGMKVKRMRTTCDRDKAARLSLETATTIAMQFSHLPASLVRVDGTVLGEETRQLQAEQLKRHQALQQLTHEMEKAMSRCRLHPAGVEGGGGAGAVALRVGPDASGPSRGTSAPRRRLDQ